MKRPLHIFLDLNHWIYLSRDYYGKSDPTGATGVAHRLSEKTRTDEVRIPLGIVHFLEHLQNENPARRTRLAEVFEIYSRGWYLAAWSDICEFEIRQALRHAFDGPTPERPTVFGRGFMSTTSAQGREILGKGHSKGFLAFVKAQSASTGALFDLLTTINDANRKKQKAVTANLSQENAVAAEDLRVRRRECSREEYRRAHHAGYTIQFEKLISREMAQQNRSMRDFLALGPEYLQRFWLGIPSMDTDCELTAYRDRQWSRRVPRNDVRDLAQLAIAIPYCDAVVVEKFWERAIIETGLGQKYGTAVFSNLADLVLFLDSKRKPKW